MKLPFITILMLCACRPCDQGGGAQIHEAGKTREQESCVSTTPSSPRERLDDLLAKHRAEPLSLAIVPRSRAVSYQTAGHRDSDWERLPRSNVTLVKLLSIHPANSIEHIFRHRDINAADRYVGEADRTALALQMAVHRKRYLESVERVHACACAEVKLAIAMGRGRELARTHIKRPESDHAFAVSGWPCQCETPAFSLGKHEQSYLVETGDRLVVLDASQLPVTHDGEEYLAFLIDQSWGVVLAWCVEVGICPQYIAEAIQKGDHSK